jgi:hypothetical protein
MPRLSDSLLVTETVASISDLLGTQIASPQTGDVLYYDGTNWVNEVLYSKTIVDGGEPNTVQYLTLASIDAGGV